MISPSRSLRGVVARPVYDRTHLVDATIATVEKNLPECAARHHYSLSATGKHSRGDPATALVIPLSMLITITGMTSEGVCQSDEPRRDRFRHHHRWCGHHRERAFARCPNNTSADVCSLSPGAGTILAGSREGDWTKPVRHADYCCRLSAGAYADGVEGKMFTPMALTVVMALAYPAALSLTFVPATTRSRHRACVRRREFS